MGEFQPFHWLLVIGAALLLFGPKKLPDIGRSLGEALGQFKKALKHGLSATPEEKNSDSAAKLS